METLFIPLTLPVQPRHSYHGFVAKVLREQSLEDIFTACRLDFSMLCAGANVITVALRGKGAEPRLRPQRVLSMTVRGL